MSRYLQTLKKYVRNPSRPEGSIAEGYLANESLNFCSHYLEGGDTKFNRHWNHDYCSNEVTNNLFVQNGRGTSDPDAITLDDVAWTQAHRYVLFNCDSITPYMKMHFDMVWKKHRRSNQIELQRIHNDDFPNWFKDHIMRKVQEKREHISEELLFLSLGPLKVVSHYKGYIINGYRFHTKTCERKRVTQNSGVAIIARTRSFSSAKDKNLISGDVTYYGILQNIIELDYYGKFKVVLFKCDWANVHAKGKGIKVDDLAFTLVNFKHLLSNENHLSDEPFIFASRAEQVFYARESMDSNWCVVKNKSRDIFDSKDNNIDDLEFSLTDRLSGSYMDFNDDKIAWTRDDMDVIVIDETLLHNHETVINPNHETVINPEEDLGIDE